MDDIWKYSLFFIVLVFGSVGLIWAFVRSAKRARNPTRTRSILDYLLIWPLILERNSAGLDAEQKRRSRSRATILWIALAVLIALAMYFRW